MPKYRLGTHTKFDLKVHVVWIPKYRKPLLVGPVATRVRDLIRQIALEHELQILSGKVARDHIHLFLAYRPHQDISTIMQWLKGISSRGSSFRSSRTCASCAGAAISGPGGISP